MEQFPLSDEPLVSCLCVTEGRPAFMPWLLWAFDRQVYRRKELVIVDSSPQSFQPAGREDVRVVVMPGGTSVPHKRNRALQEAAGEVIAWFDDDDWQHPERLTVLVQALRAGVVWAGARRGWFVDLASRRCQAYAGYRGRAVFNSAGFCCEAVRGIRFAEQQPRASDTPWMAALAARYPGRANLLDREDLFFWLCHADNLSNPARRRRFSEPLERLKAIVGAGAWGDTDTALADLRSRLNRPNAGPIPARPAKRSTSTRPVPAISGPVPSLTESAIREPEPAVGVMVKATVLDAPFLDTMVRHMLAQARYPFGERVVVVDRRVDFSGKYRDRPRLDQAALDRILKSLLDDGVIDTVRDVDMRPERVKDVMGRYFNEGAGRIPPHACTGGPIYATLFGLDSMSCDYVLQMDADVFFHAGPDSWVGRALKLLQADPGLWLLMTHPGPPAGPPGHSLGTAHAHRAAWDGGQRLWRFRHATTRYFLCDRRRLQGRLSPIWQAGGCAPLEQCLSLALNRFGAFRAALGDLKDWHLHAWHHGDPFPQWAPALARLVEAGRYPDLQRGAYDLRLDMEASRGAWAVLVSSLRPARQASAHAAWGDDDSGSVHANSKETCAHAWAASGSDSRHAPRNPPATEGCGRRLPPDDREPTPSDPVLMPAAPTKESAIAVVIPVRDRAGPRLRNTLSSLNWQTAGRPAIVNVVSHGSNPETERELRLICQEMGAHLIVAGDPAQPWNKSLALNIGIRGAPADVPYVMTMDADMILATNFLAVVLERLQRRPAALVLCRISDLPQEAALPADPAEILRSFDRLRRLAHLRPATGSGGIQAAERSFFVNVRGYDEDLLWWGGMDGDMLIRAREMKLNLAWMEGATAMLHQWHPRKHAALRDQRQVQQARQHWELNHRLVRQRARQPVRNPDGWGGVVDASDPASRPGTFRLPMPG